MTIDWSPNLQKGSKPLYQSIIEAVERDVKTGRLPAGTRMPTHRELAGKLNIALGTVTRAYNEALKRGLLRSHGRQGTFVNDPLSNGASFSRFIGADEASINLSVNHPCAAQDPDPTAVLQKICARGGSRLMSYMPAAGLIHHRRAVVKWLAGTGVDADEDSIVLTNGAQHALMITLSSIAKAGDTILTDRFTYPGIKVLAEMQGLRLAGIPYDEGGLIPDEIEKVCREQHVTALYCIPTLQNPTNTILPRSRRQQIARLASKYSFTIIEDEINRRLVPNPPPPIRSFDPDRSFLISSASKDVAGGLRTGFIVSPAAYRQTLLNMLGATSLMVSPLSFEIFTEWVNDGTAERTVANRIKEARERQKMASNLLGGFHLGTHPSSCFIWLGLPNDWSAARFTLAAYRRGVSVAPGELFAADKQAPKNTIRLCLCATESRDRLEKALKILDGIIKNLAFSSVVTV